MSEVPGSGWTESVFDRAALVAGYGQDYAQAVFPGGVNDLVAHFSDWADRQMLAALAAVDPAALRVRDRIARAVMTRIEILKPHKDAARLALSFWMMPLNGCGGVGALWQSADRIWVWAGDTATDYNRYTKRSLLSGVMSATFLAWFNADMDDDALEGFLRRRIENVMKIGQIFGKIKGSKS